MFKFIDNFIDSISMYRLLLYYLIGLLVLAVGLSIFKDIHFNPFYIVISTVILVISCWTINKILASFFHAPVNSESSLITGLILALIITPQPTGYGITFLIAASGLAMASKYILTYKKKHIFNPAALAVTLTALGPRQGASWWVGTATLLPLVLVGGIIITRKIRRGSMVISFLVATSLATIVYALLSKVSITTSLMSMVTSSPAFFLGFVMLTEPLTSPVTLKKQKWYGILVGVLLPPQFHIYGFYSTPEISLVVGNVFAYIVSPKVKLFPILKEKLKVATNTVDFVFHPTSKFAYQAGQYVEWTLPHSNIDSRGSRRYFTLASSPTEEDIRIGVKFYEQGSSFKSALLESGKKTPMVVAQVAGDFVLPKDQTKKLAFIAGGIGITPFRSMIKYLDDTKQQRDVILIYSARKSSDIAYRNIFEAARSSIGLKTIYNYSDQVNNTSDPSVRSGSITSRSIAEDIPDYRERLFYISGTHSLVLSVSQMLRQMEVPKNHIKTDFFPGYK